MKKIFAFVTLLFLANSVQADVINETFISAAGSTCRPFIESLNTAVVKINLIVKKPDPKQNLGFIMKAYSCSGVVVSSTSVYTAKHCVSLDNNAMWIITTDPEQTYYVKRVEIDVSNDLAILHVNRKFENIIPAPITYTEIQDTEVLIGTLVGFGCFGSRAIRENIYWRRDAKTSVLHVQTCVCHGDSGGGLFNSEGQLVGIIIGTHENGQSGTAVILNRNLRINSR